MSGDSPDIGAASSPAAPVPVSAAELDRRRTTYYVLFFSQIPLGIALRLVEDPTVTRILLLVTVAWLVAFEWAFLKAARLAGLSVGALVPIAVLLLVPLVGLITLLLVDFKIADTVDRGRGQAANPGPSALARLGRACRPLAGSSVDLSALVASGDLWRMTRRSPSAVPAAGGQSAHCVRSLLVGKQTLPIRRCLGCPERQRQDRRPARF